MSQTFDDVEERIDDELASKIEVFGVNEGEEETFANFMEASLSEARDMLSSNLADAKRMDKVGGFESVEAVLDPENVRDVKWEADRFKGKRVTVWLNECPIWANAAEKRTFTVGHYNDRNNKVLAVIDVRPF